MNSKEKILEKVIKKAVDFAAESIVITDVDGKILYVNPAFKKLTGFTSQQVLGKLPSMWSSKSHPATFYKKMWQTILSGKTWSGEVLNKKIDGTKYSAILSIGPVIDEKKRLVAFIAVHTDITKIRKLESALARVNRKLKKISIHDALTGIYNRRHFNDSIINEWKDAARNHSTISAIMIDVDHFKKYNDYYGHQMGDQCLKKIAQKLKTALKRPRDMAMRYGGEEFIVLLPNTDFEGGMTVANLIMSQIRKLKIPHENSETAQFVSVSMGLATVTPKTKSTAKNFLSELDRLLYSSKKNGRNQITAQDLNSNGNKSK